MHDRTGVDRKILILVALLPSGQPSGAQDQMRNSIGLLLLSASHAPVCTLVIWEYPQAALLATSRVLRNRRASFRYTGSCSDRGNRRQASKQSVDVACLPGNALLLILH
jgi:hypothetical protein